MNLKSFLANHGISTQKYFNYCIQAAKLLHITIYDEPTLFNNVSENGELLDSPYNGFRTIHAKRVSNGNIILTFKGDDIEVMIIFDDSRLSFCKKFIEANDYHYFIEWGVKYSVKVEGWHRSDDLI